MLEVFRPNLYLGSVYEIDFNKLKSDGIETILMDLDETLLPREMLHISPVLFSFIEGIKEQGFKLCLISNSFYPERVEYVARTLNLKQITSAFKPLPFAFNRAIKMLNTTPAKTAVIGDQLFMDILGGRLIGLYTIMVKPMSEETFWLRKWMRLAEDWVLNQLRLD